MEQSLTGRLEALEKRSRWLTALVAILALALVVLDTGGRIGIPAHADDKVQVFDSIVAKEIMVHSSDGRLYLKPDGLALQNKAGDVKAVLNIREGEPGLLLMDKTGHLRVLLSIFDDKPGLVIMDTKGNRRAVLGCSALQNPKDQPLTCPESTLTYNCPLSVTSGTSKMDCVEPDDKNGDGSCLDEGEWAETYLTPLGNPFFPITYSGPGNDPPVAYRLRPESPTAGVVAIISREGPASARPQLILQYRLDTSSWYSP